jgi:hypothetical protein
MGKKSRRSRRTGRSAAPRPAPEIDEREPERLLFDQIASGALDPHLTQIAEAISARSLLLQTIASAKALAELTVGDRIRINSQATPRYLHGIEGTVVDLDEESAIVCVHRPVGRFKSGEIRCPPLVLDRLPRAA